ncbi:MAG: Dabb family protein [Verrucomicrobiota bacterium]
MPQNLRFRSEVNEKRHRRPAYPHYRVDHSARRAVNSAIMMIHSVYFWLKEDCTEDDRKRMAEGLADLVKIDLIEHASVGRPAATAERPVTDHSFDASIILQFPDQAAHDAYQVHPDHDVFVAKCKDLWSKVIVYDTQT